MEDVRRSREAVSPGVDISVSRVRRADGSDIAVYALGDPDPGHSRRRIILLHGSGCDSVFPRTTTGTSVPLLFDPLWEVRHEWDVYFVEKRGVCFGQCAPPEGAKAASPEYLQGASYEGRVSDVCCVLDQIDTGRIGVKSPTVLIGSSEGSSVAVGVAAKHHAPTHIALLPFSAGHGLHDCLVTLRSELAQGAITAVQFHNQYEWLVSTFRDVFGPSRDSVDKFLWGHSYRRWSSHCSGAALADLLAVNIPVFLGIPSLDRCEGTDFVVAEFVRLRKTNLTYRNYVNYDHGFFERIGDCVECRHREVLADIFEWVRRCENR